MLSVASLIVLPAILSCIASAAIACKFLDSCARQPEMFEKFRSTYILIVATAEGLPLISVVSGIIVLFINPRGPKNTPVQEVAQIVEVKKAD